MYCLVAEYNFTTVITFISNANCVRFPFNPSFGSDAPHPPIARRPVAAKHAVPDPLATFCLTAEMTKQQLNISGSTTSCRITKRAWYGNRWKIDIVASQTQAMLKKFSLISNKLPFKLGQYNSVPKAEPSLRSLGYEGMIRVRCLIAHCAEL